MKTKIIKVEFPFYGKYQENQKIEFMYLDKLCSAIVTRKALDRFGVDYLVVGQEISIVKNFKNNKSCYVVTGVY